MIKIILTICIIGIFCSCSQSRNEKSQFIDENTNKKLSTFFSEQLKKSEDGIVLDSLRIISVDTISNKMLAEYKYDSIANALFTGTRAAPNSNIDSDNEIIKKTKANYLKSINNTSPTYYIVHCSITFHRKDLSTNKVSNDAILSNNKNIIRMEDLKSLIINQPDTNLLLILLKLKKDAHMIDQ